MSKTIKRIPESTKTIIKLISMYRIILMKLAILLFACFWFDFRANN